MNTLQKSMSPAMYSELIAWQKKNTIHTIELHRVYKNGYDVNGCYFGALAPNERLYQFLSFTGEVLYVRCKLAPNALRNEFLTAA